MELGFSFETEAKFLLRKLEITPLSFFNLSDSKHRRISFLRFPYMFVFEVMENKGYPLVYIKLLYPQKVDPGEIIKRLRSNFL